MRRKQWVPSDGLTSGMREFVEDRVKEMYDLTNLHSLKTWDEKVTEFFRKHTRRDVLDDLNREFKLDVDLLDIEESIGSEVFALMQEIVDRLASEESMRDLRQRKKISWPKKWIEKIDELAEKIVKSNTVPYVGEKDTFDSWFFARNR